MWLSKQMKPETATTDADLGVTTIAGNSVGVVTRGEVRSLPVYGPGGYVWLPENGSAVLVMKGGPGGEEQCVSGMKQKQPPAGMHPGEVYIHGPGGNAVYLRSNGSIEIAGGTISLTGGTVSIHGSLLVNGQPYRPCHC